MLQIALLTNFLANRRLARAERAKARKTFYLLRQYMLCPICTVRIFSVRIVGADIYILSFARICLFCAAGGGNTTAGVSFVRRASAESKRCHASRVGIMLVKNWQMLRFTNFLANLRLSYGNHRLPLAELANARKTLYLLRQYMLCPICTVRICSMRIVGDDIYFFKFCENLLVLRGR